MFNKLFGSSKSAQESSIDWQYLQNMDDWQTALKASEQGKVLIFKHSTRCSISSSALRVCLKIKVRILF